jgi:hypothetical protein
LIHHLKKNEVKFKNQVYKKVITYQQMQKRKKVANKLLATFVDLIFDFESLFVPFLDFKTNK